MSEQFDPQASDDYLDPQVIRCVEVHQGRFFEGGEEMGLIDGGVFHYNGMSAGGLGDLTITRYYTPPGTELVPVSEPRASKEHNESLTHYK